MKKKLLLVFSILFIVISVFACKKKEVQKTYSGSVMVYTTFDANTINTIKKDFENTYKGVVLDYFYGDINTITEKVNMAYELELPEADIILVNKENAIQSFKNHDYIKPYISKEEKNISDEYKTGSGDYYTAIIDSDNSKYYVALISNGLNIENGELFVDYLLSKKTQEMLISNGLKTVRNDIK